MGRLTGIARRDAKRAPMETLERAEISKATGIPQSSLSFFVSRERTLTLPVADKLVLRHTLILG